MPRFLFAATNEAWGAMLVSDNDNGRINCVMIHNSERQQLFNPGRREHVRRFTITVVRQQELGTTAANSEDEFDADLDAIEDTLNSSLRLGFDSNPHFKSHEGAQFHSIDPIVIGSHVCHFAQGSLTVRLLSYP